MEGPDDDDGDYTHNMAADDMADGDYTDNMAVEHQRVASSVPLLLPAVL